MMMTLQTIESGRHGLVGDTGGGTRGGASLGGGIKWWPETLVAVGGGTKGRTG